MQEHTESNADRTPRTTAELLLEELEYARALAKALVRNAADADDVVHDSLLRALRRPSALPDGVRRRSWLARTIRRSASDHARGEGRRRRREREDARATHAPDVVRALEKAELQRILMDAVLELSEPSRSVIVLSFLEGRSLRQVASITGQSVEAVKKQRQRALAQLQRSLEQRLGGTGRWAMALVPILGPWRTRLAIQQGSVITTGAVAVAAGSLVALPILASAAPLDEERALEPPTETVAANPAEPVLEALPGPRSKAATPASEPPSQVEVVAESGADGDDEDADPPTALPEMVELAVGPARIGSTREEVQALLEQEAYRRFVRILDLQTPAYVQEIERFWIGRYEVTNEEYASFVAATGHVPPIHWAPEEAEREAQTEFAQEEQVRFLEHKERNEKYERRRWDRAVGSSRSPLEQWWQGRWREVGYAIPKDEERLPVVNVDHADATAYCDWLGVRLPTEAEFQRAARGDGTRPFPWGHEWEARDEATGVVRANTSELRRAKPFPVGSFRLGASAFGVHDLAGNVWEWSSSSFLPHPDHRPESYVVHGKTVRVPETSWSESKVVVCGGSFQEPLVAARIATRRETSPAAKTNALGFRIASSRSPNEIRASW